jgi:hypothetical protein
MCVSQDGEANSPDSGDIGQIGYDGAASVYGRCSTFQVFTACRYRFIVDDAT